MSARTPRSCSGNRDRLLAASSPTGPAFEGAQISCGQRAAPGAIERVRIDPRHAGAAVPCDRTQMRGPTSRASAAARSPASAAAGSSRLVAELFLAGVLTTDGVIDGSLATRSSRVVADGRTFSYVLHERAGAPRLVLTQNDVRADPARESRAVRGVPPAHGCLRHRDRRPGPPRRRVRGAHRPAPRPGARVWCPTATRPTSPAPATPPAPAPGSPC